MRPGPCVWVFVTGLALLPLAVGQEAQEAFVIQDESNDIESGIPTNPQDSTAGFVDLQRIEVFDSPTSLELALVVGPFNEGHDAGHAYYSSEFNLFFTLYESHYRVSQRYLASTNLAAGAETLLARAGPAQLCLIDDESCRELAPPTSTLEQGTDKLLFSISKASFALSDLLAPRLGAPLTQIYATASAAGSGVYTGKSFHDRAPNDGAGGPYMFRAPAFNRAIVISAENVGGTVFVAAGQANSLELNVTNRLPERRVVKLEATLEGPGAESDLVRVDIPRMISVPAQQSRFIRLVINISGDADGPPIPRLALKGISVGYEDQGARVLYDLAVGPVIRADLSTLYLHAADRVVNSGVAGQPVPQETCTLIDNCYELFLSNVQRDERARSQDSFSDSSVSSSTDEFKVAFEASGERLGAHAQFIAGGRIDFQVTFSTRNAYVGAAAEFFLIANVPGKSATTLGEASKTFDAVAGKNAVAVQAEIKRSAPQLVPPGSSFTWKVVLHFPVEAGASEIPATKWYGGESWVRLPVRQEVNAANTQQPSAFQLTMLGEPDRYINPGEVQAFRVSLLNQIEDPQIASLAWEELPDGWAATMEPGLRFELQPGDSIALTQRVRAPMDVQEGTRVVFNLTAADEQGRKAGVRLLLTGVREIDVEDQETLYAVDPDAQTRLIPSKTPTSPDVSLLLGLLVMVVAARVRSRLMSSPG